MQQLPIIIYQDEDGLYIAECPLIQGFHAYGNNLIELYKNIEEVKELFEEEIENLEKRNSNNFVSVSLLPLKKSFDVTYSYQLKGID